MAIIVILYYTIILIAIILIIIVELVDLGNNIHGKHIQVQMTRGKYDHCQINN